MSKITRGYPVDSWGNIANIPHGLPFLGVSNHPPCLLAIFFINLSIIVLESNCLSFSWNPNYFWLLQDFIHLPLYPIIYISLDPITHIYICISIYIVYINIPTKCVDKYLKNVHLPPKFSRIKASQVEPGQDLAAVRRHVRLEVLLGYLLFLRGQGKKPMSYPGNRDVCVFAMKLLYTYISLYMHICMHMYVYILCT